MRRALALLVGATLFLFATAGTATPDGTIAIRGAAAGTHLRLSIGGSELTVTGSLESVSDGCRFTRGLEAASCQLDGAGALEIATGPADDKIEVLEPLPISLTAYLGAGSDKLIGNSESDVCYPQDTARNRCVGNDGDDVCISGPVNTDCVGGPGDDYCRTASGSDGCWGGPGDDECLMGDGHDGCHGEGGNDRLFGGPDSDRLYGGGGFDFCDGGPGAGRSRECQAGPRH